MKREFWLVLVDTTPGIPGSSNRKFIVEHAPVVKSMFEPIWTVLDIIHVREVE